MVRVVRPVLLSIVLNLSCWPACIPYGGTGEDAVLQHAVRNICPSPVTIVSIRREGTRPGSFVAACVPTRTFWRCPYFEKPFGGRCRETTVIRSADPQEAAALSDDDASRVSSRPPKELLAFALEATKRELAPRSPAPSAEACAETFAATVDALTHRDNSVHVWVLRRDATQDFSVAPSPWTDSDWVLVLNRTSTEIHRFAVNPALYVRAGTIEDCIRDVPP